MTQEQEQENILLGEMSYQLNKHLLHLKTIIDKLKSQKLTNVLKQHQAMMKVNTS